MKTVEENQYIKIIDNGIFEPRKTHSYHIKNKRGNYHLGYIEWYSAWRQYCFMPNKETVWNKHCLETIISFLTEINTEHRKSWNQKKNES